MTSVLEAITNKKQALIDEGTLLVEKGDNQERLDELAHYVSILQEIEEELKNITEQNEQLMITKEEKIVELTEQLRVIQAKLAEKESMSKQDSTEQEQLFIRIDPKTGKETNKWVRVSKFLLRDVITGNRATIRFAASGNVYIFSQGPEPQ